MIQILVWGQSAAGRRQEAACGKRTQKSEVTQGLPRCETHVRGYAAGTYDHDQLAILPNKRCRPALSHTLQIPSNGRSMPAQNAVPEWAGLQARMQNKRHEMMTRCETCGL
jgi:hypothetical protein